MGNEQFFKGFKEFIIDTMIQYNKDDLWVYYEILYKYKSKGEIQEMIYNCNNILNIRYIAPTQLDDYWNCCDNGTIIIDTDNNGATYELALHYYGTYTINIEKIDYYDRLDSDEKIESLRDKWLEDVTKLRIIKNQKKINEIDEEINRLMKVKNELKNNLVERMS